MSAPRRSDIHPRLVFALFRTTACWITFDLAFSSHCWKSTTSFKTPLDRLWVLLSKDLDINTWLPWLQGVRSAKATAPEPPQPL